MPEPGESLSPAEQAGERVARSTIVRAVGEIVGKLASLALFAVMAREFGESGLGAFLFAFAWTQLATIPLGIGFDRLLLRRVAAARSAIHGLFFNVLTLKAGRALGMAGGSLLVVWALGYDGETVATVAVLTVGLSLEAVARTLWAVFSAHERSELIAVATAPQRIVAAALGIWALSAGHGIVTVAACYSLGGALALGTGLLLLRKVFGMPRWEVDRGTRRDIRSRSWPFATQDIVGEILARIDAVLLSLIATNAAVGRYGAAYRLLESTLFITHSLNSAFSAMYTYLSRESEPTIGAVYARSVKLALLALVPVGVAFGVLADPIVRAFFGDELAGAADPLRILSPAVALVGVVMLSTSLLISRGEPRRIVRISAGALVLNVVLDLALIPPLEEVGAAVALLTSYSAYFALTFASSIRDVGGIPLAGTFLSALAGGLAMAAPMALLDDSLALACVAGAGVYLAAVGVLERIVSPEDVRFVREMMSRRLSRSQAPGSGSS